MNWLKKIRISERTYRRNKNKKLPENSEEYKLITLYNSYLNTARRDKEGINPIKEDLAAINAIKNLDDIQKYTVKKTKEWL